MSPKHICGVVLIIICDRLHLGSHSRYDFVRFNSLWGSHLFILHHLIVNYCVHQNIIATLIVFRLLVKIVQAHLFHSLRQLLLAYHILLRLFLIGADVVLVFHLLILAGHRTFLLA